MFSLLLQELHQEEPHQQEQLELHRQEQLELHQQDVILQTELLDLQEGLM